MFLTYRLKDIVYKNRFMKEVIPNISGMNLMPPVHNGPTRSLCNKIAKVFGFVFCETYLWADSKLEIRNRYSKVYTDCSEGTSTILLRENCHLTGLYVIKRIIFAIKKLRDKLFSTKRKKFSHDFIHKTPSRDERSLRLLTHILPCGCLWYVHKNRHSTVSVGFCVHPMDH